jgi:arylsulfatase A-like enzyme
MKRSVLYKLFIIVAASLQGLMLSCKTEVQDLPNILFIVTDDQGYGDLSIHGNTDLETPNIDKIGQQGVRFERFYVSTVCAPSRASILTGRYHLRTGTHNVTANREAMRPEEITIAEALKPAGYHTGCIGKWHNGIQFPYNPTGQGFDEFYGFTGGHINNYFLLRFDIKFFLKDQ